MIATIELTEQRLASNVTPNRQRVRDATTATRGTSAHLRSSAPLVTSALRSAHLRMTSAAAAAALLLLVASCLAAVAPVSAFTSVAPPSHLGPAFPSSTIEGRMSRGAPLHAHFLKQQKQQLPIMDAQVVATNKGKTTTNGAQADDRTRTLNPTPVLFAAFEDFLEKNRDNPATSVAAVLSAFALATILMLSPLSADAAMSGGRMGGSFPSSRQSYSRPAPSYGGGYSSGYRSGYGSSFYNRGPGITVLPPPIVAPISPFGGFGFGFGNPFYFGAPGVMTYSRGPGLFDLLLWGGIGLFLLNAFRGAASAVDGAANSFASALDDKFGAEASALGPGTSVVQLTVALEVPKRDDPSSILSVLNRLAATARTDSRVGIQNLTSQVALELLRRKASIVSASASSQHYNSRDKALRNYNSASIKERAKFEQETVSQYGGVDYYGDSSSSARSSGSSLVDGQATMAVVTLLLAIDGDSTKLPNISSMSSVEEALRKIAGDAKVDTCLQSAEILWTPTDRSETLTLRDVVADYPQLRSV